MVWKAFKRLIDKEKYPVENGVKFIHHMPDRGNIGDFLCSPRHYFFFEPNAKGLVILGGGVYKNLGLDKVHKVGLDPQKVVLWAAGQSLRPPQVPRTVESLPFLLWSTRDKDLVAGQNFVPCCSCLHSMLDSKPVGDHTLLFLNADQKVSAPSVSKDCAVYASHKGWKLLYNDCSEEDFYDALWKSKNIVTNSYHGAYWGLLSGRNVKVIGYSSKFRSLLASFGIGSELLISMDKGSGESLISSIEKSADSGFISLPNPDEVLSDFREKNVNFAKRLVASGVMKSFDFKKDRVAPRVLGLVGGVE